MEAKAKKSKTARAVMKLGSNYDRLLSTILIGNNITNIAASAIATVFFTQHWNDMGPTYATIVVTLCVLIFGEVTPKSLARERAEDFAMLNVYPLWFFYFLFYPISLFFELLQKLVKRMFRDEEDDVTLTEEEFKLLIEDVNDEGVLNDIESSIIQNTLEYGDTRVKEVMQPVSSIVYISNNEPKESILKKFIDSDYSRVPVSKTSRPNGIYGILLQKDFYEMEIKQDVALKDLINPILETKPTIKISRLLKTMQRERQQMAVVKLNGAVLGIITMEDILEELVGEIKDETDE